MAELTANGGRERDDDASAPRERWPSERTAASASAGAAPSSSPSSAAPTSEGADNRARRADARAAGASGETNDDEERRSDFGADDGDDADDGEQQRTEAADSERHESQDRSGKKRRHALVFGYDGSSYSGLQFQRNQAHVRTVEGDLHHALCKAGAVSAENATDLSKISWSRSSRTDRGVHAASQVTAANLVVANDDPAALTAALNAELAPRIRVYDVVRVPNTFDAHTRTKARTYTYVFPLRCAAPAPDPAKPAVSALDVLLRVRAGFSAYVGTREYHNFCEGVKQRDPRARRHNSSCTASLCELVGGELVPVADADASFAADLVAMRVRGSSFLMYQIRRMVGFVVEASRRLDASASADDVRECVARFLRPEVCAVAPPTAPSEGLYLDVVALSTYAVPAGSYLIDFEAEPLKSQRERVLRDLIGPAVAARVGRAFDVWLADRRFSPFPAFVESGDLTKNEDEALADVELFLDGVRERHARASKLADYAPGPPPRAGSSTPV